ncbi:MAG: class I SAM-dependent methyltransferase [Holophaga sp.]|nr:class I SAM-dependent methyltransferase [Holophaga sp.]
MVPYYRCEACGFLFTRFFDHWTDEEFQGHVYNEAYPAVDPEFANVRPTSWAKAITDAFPNHLSEIEALDWGGGTGRLAELLQAHGVRRAETWEPFNLTFAAQPKGDFNLVSCIEVLEHLPDPKAGIRSLVRSLRTEGAVLISTLLQPTNIREIGTAWWYLAPRNGHISLHSAKSLELIFKGQGCHLKTVMPHVHWAWRQVPFYLKNQAEVAKQIQPI